MANKMREWSASERKSAQTSAKAWQDFFVKGGATQQTELEALGRVVEVRQLHEAELLALDGVVGVAESYKVKAGKPTKEWAIIVLVEEKQRKSGVGKRDLVPAEISGIPTDVMEVGKLEALARISHTIFARSGGVARRFVRTCWLVASGGRERSWDFPGLRGAAKTWSRWAWDDAAVVTRCGGA